jgi:hypothetical protein
MALIDRRVIKIKCLEFYCRFSSIKIAKAFHKLLFVKYGNDNKQDKNLNLLKGAQIYYEHHKKLGY